MKTIFATANADEASAIARRMRIDYLYVDATDAQAYPDGVRKFDEHPELFSRVFASGDVRVYRTLERIPCKAPRAFHRRDRRERGL